MNYGTAVTVLSDKIRMSERELAPLGIVDNSRCWCRWMPDRRASAKENVDHLVISPYNIEAWPVLFRLAVVLDDDLEASLARALRVLHATAFNILSIEAAPAGHHHSIVNIVGESVALKHDKELFQYPRTINDIDRTFFSAQTRDYVHTRFVPKVLTYLSALRFALLSAHDEDPFLRESFVYGKRMEGPRGTLYDPNAIHADFAETAREQCTEAVSVKWLQNHAFYWLYGRGNPAPQLLTFTADSWALRPEGHWRHEFADRVRDLRPPFKAMTSINFEEHCLRVVLSRPPVESAVPVRIKLPYTATYDEDASTIGLLRNLCDSMAKRGISLRSVNISTESREPRVEEGTLLLVADTNRPSRTEAIAFARTALNDCTAEVALGLGPHCKATFHEPQCTAFGARVLFLSTKFQWLDVERKGLEQRIRALALEYGFVTVLARESALDDERRIHWSAAASLTFNITKLMRSADAFLQVCPRAIADTANLEGNLNWLLFESGAAHARRLPTAVCVDTADGVQPERWALVLRAGAGEIHYPFKGDQGDDAIIEGLRPALDALSHQPRPH